jgi:lipopolysaccharide transport system ATP-binding protein
MSSDLAIRIDGVGKSYRIRHHERHVTLAEQMLHRVRHPLQRTAAEEYWALQDVWLHVERGTVLGLIGRNGAGKSTLLKVLSRITAPTKGRIELFGRVGSLLEVGTGFHPELTGRENVYLNGSILGMRRKEIDRQFDAIVDFAGVANFLDTPVKRYSSGMYVRLAFAVAAHLETEILLVDEVLAVGDQEFQERCLGKMHEVANDGRTVILVSHNLDSIARLCDRAALLDRGSLVAAGDPASVLETYVSSLTHATRDLSADRRAGSGEWRVTQAEPVGAPFTADGPKRFRIRAERRDPALQRFFVSVHVVDELRRVVAQCDSRLTGTWFTADDDVAEIEFTLTTPWLLPGSYELDVFVCNAGVIDACEGAARFEVSISHPYRSPLDRENSFHNLVLPQFEYGVGPCAPASSRFLAGTQQ